MRSDLMCLDDGFEVNSISAIPVTYVGGRIYMYREHPPELVDLKQSDYATPGQQRIMYFTTFALQ